MSKSSEEVLLRLQAGLDTLHFVGRPRARAAEELVAGACARFGDIIRPSCYTVYLWNHILCRTWMLTSHGLEFPEAVGGIGWINDLPRKALFRGDSGSPRSLTIFDASEKASGPDAGTFRMRESIAKTWAVVVPWSRWRAVIFLNWRSPDGPVYTMLHGRSKEPVSEALLAPAARYLAGWLNQSGATPDGGARPLKGIEEYIQIIRESASRDPQHVKRIADEVVKPIAAPGQPPIRCNIAWLETPRPKEAPVIRFTPGGQTYSVIGDPNNRGKVPERSIAAQSVAWRVSILINDLQSANPYLQTINVTPDAERRWSKGSQLTIPIRNSRAEIRAVAALASASTDVFKPHSAAHAQRFLQLYSTLLDLKDERPGPRADHPYTKALDLLDELCHALERAKGPATRGPDPMESPLDVFMSGVCDWCQERLGAHLVHALTYHVGAGMFLPEGIAVAKELRREIGRFYKPDPSSNAPLGDPRAIKDAIRFELIPSWRGRSWRLFTGAHDPVVAAASHGRTLRHPEAVALWPVDDEIPPPSPLSCRYFEIIAGLPLASCDGAQPDGVVWFSWMKHTNSWKNLINADDSEDYGALNRANRDRRANGSYPPPSRDDVKDALISQIKRHVGTMLHFAAAAVDVLRVPEPPSTL